MRRQRAANWTIALGVALGSFAAGRADGPPAPLRPQAKIVVYQPPVNGQATVAVMGQVSQPGTYQFPAAPTLGDVVRSAEGLKPAASPMIRIVRGNRVAQRVSLTTSAEEKLQPGDLVIVDAHPIRDRSQPAAPAAAESAGVQLALLGVVNRPLVVKVHASRAKTESILQMLGQTSAGVNVLPSPNAPRDPSGMLADGTVLMFDSRRIQVADLPDDLPKIIPCGLPIPDIGGYGIHHAIEERRMDPTPEMAAEGAVPWSSSPQPDDLTQVPLPELDANMPASPTPIDNRIAATFSSSVQPQTSISRVPFPSRQGTAARPTRLSGSAPADSIAVDAKEPAWNKVASAMDDPTLAAYAEAAGVPAATGLSLLQIGSILISLGLIAGLGYALRVRQAVDSQQHSIRDTTLNRSTHAATAGTLPDKIRVESRASIPTPHIPMQSFTAVAAASAVSHAAAIPESRDERELAFRGILKNELPVIAEPLALRPGLKISLPHEDGAFRRVDSTDNSLPAPHRTPAHMPHIAAAQSGQPAAERHIIDQPHAGPVPAPHHRTGVEAPVDRALRRLQGGAR